MSSTATFVLLALGIYCALCSIRPGRGFVKNPHPGWRVIDAGVAGLCIAAVVVWG